jgi:3D (Asp-Asp-Asp) domain-containing protein/SH3-like domain-containing protein
MTTALVLIAAVFVVFIFRLITSDDEEYIENPIYQVTDPSVAEGENLLEIEGFIDRHQPEGELAFLLDEAQAPIHTEAFVIQESEETKPPTTQVSDESLSTTPTQTIRETTTTKAVSGTTFREVDIRYYVLSEDGLNFREAPSTQAPVKQKLEYGMGIRVIALGDDWVKVRLAGEEIGYVSKKYISQYPPVTTTLATTQPQTTKAPSTTAVNTTKAPSGQGSSPIKFVTTGGQNAMVAANLNLLKSNGLINKAGSPSINRHYANFTDNGDGTITVDGVTFHYIDHYGSRYATHYDGLEVCQQQIKARGGKCSLGHTTPTNHHTGSGVMAQRGIVAVGAQDIGIYPRGTVLFVRGYGMAVVGDRSGGNFDLSYDPGECAHLTRSNSVSAIYVISRP